MAVNKLKTITITGKPGQLGNMLFLFANLIAFGIEKNIVIKAPAFADYADYFSCTRNTILPSYPCKDGVRSKTLRRFLFNLLALFSKACLKFNLSNSFFASIYIDWHEKVNLEEDATLNKFNSRYVFINGWQFRSFSLMQKHKYAILDFFKPEAIHITHIAGLLKNHPELLIGVHIRHGDYKNFDNGKYFYSFEQYEKLMQQAKCLFPQRKITFLLCTNSTEPIPAFEKLDIIKGTNMEVEDLYSFTKCNYILGPPSTFSMWASFYGNVPLYQVHDPNAPFTLEHFKIVKG
jgi:hypothetical protein